MKGERSGIVFPSGKSLDAEYHSLLEEGYPGISVEISVDSCRILHVGVKLPNAKSALAL